MKKLFLILMLLIPIGISAQSHNIVKELYGGVIFKDSVRFVADSTHSPIRDSIHVINAGLQYEYGRLTVLASTDNDSLKITGGVIGRNYRGVAVDTVFSDEMVMRDSSWTIVARALSSTANAKAYTIFPIGELVKIELINYRAAVPTRVANYRLELFKKTR